ncbi:hypothetical protein [Paenibacillus xylanilyticus]|uniref:hypothetical protein n=1 Tax=Paenibacillus xylanilyticus TaxID=248903 RepID=UPI0039A072C5
MLYLIIVIVIGFAGIISNQYAGLKRMDSLQKSIDELNRNWREIGQRQHDNQVEKE